MTTLGKKGGFCPPVNSNLQKSGINLRVNKKYTAIKILNIRPYKLIAGLFEFMNKYLTTFQHLFWNTP